MSSGSVEPEGEDDRQCIHCGLWWCHQGLHKHEENCQLEPFDRRLIDLVDRSAIMRAPDVELEDLSDRVVDVDQEDAGDVDQGDDHGRAAGALEVDPVSSDPTPSTAPMRTDGGPSAVPGGWSDAAAGAGVDDVDQEDDDEATCPECGSADWFDVSDLPGEVLAAKPKLANHDRACHPCSTDDQGRLRGQVVVYNV